MVKKSNYFMYDKWDMSHGPDSVSVRFYYTSPYNDRRYKWMLKRENPDPGSPEMEEITEAAAKAFIGEGRATLVVGFYEQGQPYTRISYKDGAALIREKGKDPYVLTKSFGLVGKIITFFKGVV